MATPFIGKTFTFTQPDGSKIQVRGWGDQHYAVFETLDGYTVVKNPGTGFYEIAQLSGDGTMLESVPGDPGHLDGARAGVPRGVRIDREAARTRGREGALHMGGRRCDRRREERKNRARAARSLESPLRAPPQRGTEGDFVGLCLLIDFADDPGTISREEVEDFCNQHGYPGFGNNGSVYDYFYDNSLGRCRYTNIVADYYRAQHPKSYYTNPAIPQGIRARQLIIEALTFHQANQFDFSPLSADSGEYVYAMNVYYAGDVQNNWSEGLWPHASYLGSAVPLAPDKKAHDYQITDMGQELSLGTFCHENGHMLCDYPDLYDYGNESSGVGAYCLMCSGANIDEKNPSHICAYLKRLSGWAENVTTIQHNGEITLAAGANEFAVFARDGQEYFVLENRVKSGRDVSLPDEGLAIWHVDEEGDNSNEQMTPWSHYELSLEQADAKFDFETLRYHYGSATDLYGQANKRFADSTAPASKWWDGTASNLDIYDISAPGSLVSFKTRLSQDDEDPLLVQGESEPGLPIPDNRAEGITDSIAIDENAIIASIQVTLDITHTYRGDLRVTLLTPWGDAFVLHDKHQGGSADDIQTTIDESDLQTLATLHGRSTQGSWRLTVQDLASVDTGTLNRWALAFDTVGSSQGDVVLEEAPGTHIPDDDPMGISRHLTASAPGSFGSVEVSVNITHTYIADLKISLISPVGTEVILHDGGGGDADDIVTTYTAATTPELGNLAGQSISGTWQLTVSDRAGQDVGKLNTWRIVIHPAQT